MESGGGETVGEVEAPAVAREPAGAPTAAGAPLPAPPLLARPLAAAGKGAAAVGKGAVGAAWRAGWGSFTVNLFRRRHKEERWTDFLAPRRAAASSFAEGGGVSVKIMRHWSAFDRRRPEGDAAGPPRPPFRPAVDLAIGLGFDEGAFEPRCRLKVANVVTVKLLPEPALKAKYLSRPLPGTRLAVEAAWFSPLRNLTGPADLVKPPAGVYVRLRNARNAGPALNGRGLEWNQVSASACMRPPGRGRRTDSNEGDRAPRHRDEGAGPRRPRLSRAASAARHRVAVLRPPERAVHHAAVPVTPRPLLPTLRRGLRLARRRDVPEPDRFHPLRVLD